MPKFEITSKGGRIYLNGKRLRKLPVRSKCRDVYATDKYVIKVDVEKLGGPCDWQSRTEWKKWQSLSNYNKRHFAKIFAFGTVKIDGHLCDYVVQKRVKYRRSPNARELELIHDLGERLGISDIAVRNIRVNEKDRIVFIDYGLSEENSY